MVGYSIRELGINDLPDALSLVWNVFLEFEAPDYCADGIQEFKSFIELESIKENLIDSEFFMWGCFDVKKIVGVIATRLPSHISLLFVDKQYHKKGIAHSLFDTVLKFYNKDSIYEEITVNSSPYAAQVYHRLGFTDLNTEREVNGIRFIPMKYKL